MADEPYNPLDKRRLGESVATALLKRPAISLPTAPFAGAGIYALYYTGSFPAYKKIAEKNKNGRWNAPIYVGKAAEHAKEVMDWMKRPVRCFIAGCGNTLKPFNKPKTL